MQKIEDYQMIRRVYKHRDDILALNCGDVALLKGETWDGNKMGGLGTASASN